MFFILFFSFGGLCLQSERNQVILTVLTLAAEPLESHGMDWNGLRISPLLRFTRTVCAGLEDLG